MAGSPENRLAAANIAWNPLEHGEELAVFSAMRRRNVTGVEVAGTMVFEDPTKVPDRTVELYRQICLDQGIQPIAVTSLLFGRPELKLFNQDTRGAMEEHLKRMMHFAKQLGAETVVFGSAKNRKRPEAMPPAEADDIAVDFLQRMGEVAKSNELVFALEPVHSMYDTNFATTTQESLSLVERAAHPNVGLHLDTGTAFLNGEVAMLPDLLQRAQPYLQHVHVSHPGLEAITINKDSLTPERISQHRSVAAALRDIGYDGWISLEMVARKPEANVRNVRQGLAALQYYYGR